MGYPDIPHYTLAEDDQQQPQDWDLRKAPFDLLESSLTKLNPCPGSLVFLDPVAPLYIKGDQNSAKDVAVSLHWFRRCMRKWQCTFLCSANQAKPKQEAEYARPQDRISGSGAFVAYSDTTFYIEEPREDGEPTTFGWKPRGAPAGQYLFERNDVGLFVPFKGLRDESDDASTDRPTLLLNLIPEEGISRGDLEALAKEQLSISRSAVDRALKKLKERKLIQWDSWGAISRRKVN